MKYLLGIFYVNGPGLLERAAASVRPLWPCAVLLDNSPDGELAGHALARQLEVVRPLVPLSFAQSMNALFGLAERRGAAAALVMHHDAEAEGDAALRLVEEVAAWEAAARPWGVAFTHYDALAAFRLRAVRAVGPWDPCLPQYFADNDYYRRLRLAGYETVDTGLPVRHRTSSTIRDSPERAVLNAVTFPLYAQYYARKWGGPPGAERFTVPFGGGPGSAIVFPHDVEGWLFEPEARRLADLAAGKRVLEVGSWCGLSTICLAQTAAVVHAVDWHRGDPHAGQRDTLATFLANLRRYQVADRVVPHVARFEEVAPALAPVFELAFIDAFHEEETVRRHAALASRLLVAGGTLAFHDYGRADFPGVQAVVDQLAAARGVPVRTVATLAVLEGVPPADGSTGG